MAMKTDSKISQHSFTEHVPTGVEKRVTCENLGASKFEYTTFFLLKISLHIVHFIHPSLAVHSCGHES